MAFQYQTKGNLGATPKYSTLMILCNSEAYLIPHKPDLLPNSHGNPQLLVRNSQQQLVAGKT